MIRLLLAIGILVGYTTSLGFIYLGVLAASIGFWPSIIGSLLVWAYALYTGFLYLNVCSSEPPGANIPTLSSKYFGPLGKGVSLSFFLLLNYGYSINYIIFGSSVIFGALQPLLGGLSEFQMYLILFVLWSFFLFLGSRICAGFNFLFVCGLIGSLIVFFSYGNIFPHHDIMFTNWIYLFLGISGLYDILFFHSAIPLIFSMLKGNLKLTKTAIWIGTLVPLLLYYLWIWLIVTPRSEIGFILSFENYDSFFEDLQAFYSHYMARKGLEWIPVFGAATGLLSTGLCSFHFFSDLFQNVLRKRRVLKQAAISILIALPPAVISLLPHSNVRKTINILEGFLEIALGAAVPILLFWSMRYIRNVPILNKIYCNKKILVFLSILTVFLFYIEGISILNIIIW